MKRFTIGLVIWTLVAVVGVALAQYKSPDQRARPGNQRANTLTATTIQAGVVPPTVQALAGTGSLIGCAQGTGPTSGLAGWDLMWCDSTYAGFKVNNNNSGNQYVPFVSSLPSINGQSPTFNTSGVFTAWQGQQGWIGWDGALGSYLTTARKIGIAVNAGHFTNLIATAVLTGSCTTNPEFNVYDITQSTSGTATASLTTTVAAPVSATQILPFAAGDQIAIGVSTAGATCTAPVYSVTATMTQP